MGGQPVICSFRSTPCVPNVLGLGLNMPDPAFSRYTMMW